MEVFIRCELCSSRCICRSDESCIDSDLKVTYALFCFSLMFGISGFTLHVSCLSDTALKPQSQRLCEQQDRREKKNATATSHFSYNFYIHPELCRPLLLMYKRLKTGGEEGLLCSGADFEGEGCSCSAGCLVFWSEREEEGTCIPATWLVCSGERRIELLEKFQFHPSSALVAHRFNCTHEAQTPDPYGLVHCVAKLKAIK